MFIYVGSHYYNAYSHFMWCIRKITGIRIWLHFIFCYTMYYRNFQIELQLKILSPLQKVVFVLLLANNGFTDIYYIQTCLQQYNKSNFVQNFGCKPKNNGLQLFLVTNILLRHNLGQLESFQVMTLRGHTMVKLWLCSEKVYLKSISMRNE